jgi:hypothetical protein
MQATDEFENQNACNRKAKSSLRHQNPETIATSNNNQYSKPENPNTYIFSKKIW